jgi:hypothetical protein
MRDHHELAMEEHARRATWMQETGGYAKDMTVRDELAGRAMQGLLGDHVRNFDLLAIEAYQMADAMLAAREAK